jgi:hypothetical protein
MVQPGVLGHGWPIGTREEAMPVATELRGVVADFVAAVNDFDLDRIVATFTPDA